MALTRLPYDITLHLQGGLPADGGMELQSRIAKLGLKDRVVIHARFTPDEAVREAAKHHVGLCLERRGCRNHHLTASNKIFDYHMAGLAVIASDLPGLRGVLERSQGGLLYEAGSVECLTSSILSLHRSRQKLTELSRSSREFAMREGNRDVERKKFVDTFSKVFQKTTRA